MPAPHALISLPTVQNVLQLDALNVVETLQLAEPGVLEYAVSLDVLNVSIPLCAIAVRQTLFLPPAERAVYVLLDSSFKVPIV